MSKILLKNGTVVSSKESRRVDILIQDEKIVEIAESIEASEEVEVIDCGGKMILPGLIDAHVHFRVPGAEHKEDWNTGSKAAVSGGVTMVLDMPNNNPPIMTVKDMENKRDMIKGQTYIDYGLYMGCNGKNIDEINKVTNVPGVKIYVANSTGDLGVGVNAVRDVCEHTDKLIVVHCEDEDCIEKHRKDVMADYEEEQEPPPEVHSKIRAPECALMIVEKVCEMAKEFDNHLHIAHVSTAAELDAVSKYKEYGLTAEVTPHHLLISEDDYSTFGNFIRVNPPIRAQEEVFSLWKSLKSGLIDIIATDHAPHTLDEKERGYNECPSGIPEVETTLPVLLDIVNNEGISLEELVKLCCERPAEIFHIQNKGKIEKGYDADIVVVDLDVEKKVENKNLYTKCGWSPYDGRKLKGWPVMTFVRGQLVYDGEEIIGQPKGREAVFT